MNESFKKFNIDEYIKEGFDPVVELDDDVEYLLESKAIEQIKNNEPIVVLKRLIDGETISVGLERIVASLKKNGPIDYLKNK